MDSSEKSGLDPKHIEIVVEDRARGVQAQYEPLTEAERALNRRVNSKLDCCVLALLAVEFIFCGIDKTNVGFVATSSFPKDARLGKDAIPYSLSLFSATYVVFQPVMVILARRVGVKYFIAIQLIIWGAICMCHAAIRSRGTLIALRLLIGVAEAGFTQIGNYYMSTLYPRSQLAWRVGIFSGMYSIAGAFAGLIAYGLLKISTPRIHGWQAVFLLEGGFTVLLGILSLIVLPRRLATAWFLNDEERRHAVYRMEVDLAGTQEEADVNSTRVTRRDVVDVARDWKKLLTVVCNITTVLPVSAFTTFMPLVVKGMGFSGTDATLMSAPPFAAGVVGLLIIVRSSDHFRERSLHIVFGLLIGMIGCIVMATSTDNKLRYGFSYVCMTGVFVGGPLVAVWLAGNTPWKGSRSVILGINGWSNVAGVIAGQIFRDKYAPRYEVPLIITICIMVAGACGLVFLRLMYQRENRKRAEEIATWDEQRFAEESSSEVRRGDQRKTFMYGL